MDTPTVFEFIEFDTPGITTPISYWDDNNKQLQCGYTQLFGDEPTKRTPLSRVRLVVQPDSKAWAHFQEQLKKLGVWEWKTEYFNEDQHIGIGWELNLEWGNQKKQCHGINCFPENYKAFVHEVSSLFGEKDHWVFE